MKVLLDENMPHKLRSTLASHEVATAAYMGWAGVKNGQLLEAAEMAGFEVLVTADQNLSYQQNLTHRRIALVVLSTPRWTILRHHLVKVEEVVGRAVPGSFERVECGAFRRGSGEAGEGAGG